MASWPIARTSQAPAPHAKPPHTLLNRVGLPALVDGATVFSETPEQMAAAVPDILAAGARLVGGCCGTTDAHIRAIAVAVRAAAPTSSPAAGRA